MPTKHRTPGKNSKWYLPKWEYRTVVAFCLQYKDLQKKKAELDAQIHSGMIKGVSYDGMPHGSSPGDPTYQYIVKREADLKRIAEIDKKIGIIESNVNMVSRELNYWMLKAITEEDATYDKLRYEEGMPLPKNAYSCMRREIYYRISKSI